MIVSILLFVAAAYFIVLACTDTYAPKGVRMIFGDFYGHDTNLFYIRWIIGGVLIALGVWLL